jgi:hypothetical protein
VLARVIEAAGSVGSRWRAGADAVVFRVAPAASAALERSLHAALVESPR